MQTMMNVEGNEFVVDLLSSVEVVMIEENTDEGLEYRARIAAEAEAAAVSALTKNQERWSCGGSTVDFIPEIRTQLP